LLLITANLNALDRYTNKHSYVSTSKQVFPINNYYYHELKEHHPKVWMKTQQRSQI